MTSEVTQFLIAAVVIVFAGGALTQFGEIISNRSKMGGMLVGGILIAGATSLPELAININVVRKGSADLAVGSLVGSNLFNLLILAVCDLTRYSKGHMLSRTSAGNALSAITSTGLASLAAIFIFLGPQLGSSTFLRAGPGSYLLAFVYLVGIRMIYFEQGNASKDPDASDEENKSVIARLRHMGLKGGILGFIGAATVILIAAPFLATAAQNLSDKTGLGGTFFGSVFVGLSTSLPEVVTVFTAIRMKAFEIAVGNIFGSNCFNILLLVPLDFVFEGSLLSAAASTHVYTALCGVLVTAVVILGQLFDVEKKHRPFLEPDAWMAIVLIVAGFTGLYFIK